MTKFERFKKGLEDYNLTYDEIIKSGWNYCGGNFDSHRNYYTLRFGAEEPLLPHNSECVCGQKGLINNGYICNKKETDFLVLGSCCVKQFIGGRTCEVCGEGHRRYTRNVCKDCEKFQRKVNGKWRTLKTMKCETENCNKIINHSTWRKKCRNCYHRSTLKDKLIKDLEISKRKLAEMEADDIPLPSGWELRMNAAGRQYYVDHTTKTTSWTHPGEEDEYSDEEEMALRLLSPD
tara:strand:- start:165 stop:866 length:702 start_codon:yes stop_codon:yes gene_type:complete